MQWYCVRTLKNKTYRHTIQIKMKTNFIIESDFCGQYFMQFKKGQRKEQNMKTYSIQNFVEAILIHYSLNVHIENQ